MHDHESATTQRIGEIDVVLCDLDGVVWLARSAIAGAADAVERLRAGGRRVLFVTNNSVSAVDEVEAALDAIGIPAAGDVLTSAQAAASLVTDGDEVLVCGGRGVHEAVSERGATVVPPADAKSASVAAVVVGLDREFSFATLSAASRAIRHGARFIATNDDATFPTPDGLTPGAGSIVAAVATAAGQAPEIAGKPHPAMARLVAARCGSVFDPARTLMVGDRWSTDGVFAETIGCPFALVRSGVTPPGAATSDGFEVNGAELDVPDLVAVADVLA